MTEKDRLYAWLALLDHEAQVSKREPATRPVGRPPSPFKKQRVRFNLIPEQVDLLDEIVEMLSDEMGKSIGRYQVVGFLIYYLWAALKNRDHGSQLSFSSFTDLGVWLNGNK